MRCGFGSYYWIDGTKFRGHWKKDKGHGFGTLYHSNGDIYQG